MKKILLIAVLLMNFIAVSAHAQCEETYILCKKQFSKADKKAGWNVNKQSLGIAAEKGQVFETTLSAYKGLEYRLSVCSEIDGGTAADFILEQETRVTVTDSAGNTSIERQRTVIFDSTTDPEEFYVLFRSNKTEKFYLTVNVPSGAKSSNKKLKNTESICIGILLEHRKTKKSAL
jgi:hypothetical protein